MPRAARLAPISPFLQALATIALVVFVMYAARPVIIPIALAVLGAFVLAPIVALLEKRIGLGRVPASLLALTLAGLVVFGIGWVIVTNATSLAAELPKHKDQIKKKIDDLRGSGGPISAVVEMFRDLTREPDKAPATGPNAPTNPDAPPKGTAEDPVKVETVNRAPPAGDRSVIVVSQATEGSAIATLAQSAGPVVEQLATAALIVVLTAFMLIGREDLRDRMLGVIGEGRLLGATRVLSEAAHKVSRFLLFQLIVNAGFGTILTIGLLIIGVPFAPLWGFLSGILRFIPYIGTWISAVFPVALSFATSDGWTQPIEVFAFFAVLDLITANVVEPLLFGHHTGVSPLALLIAVVFFTWIWGPLGLLLSTPITVCLAVIGQHVPSLRPLALLLGDQPALPAAVQYYQRLVANDKVAATTVASQMAAADGALATYDGMVIPALTLASRDRAAGDLTAEEESTVFEETADIVTATAEAATKKADAAAEVSREAQPSAAAPPVRGVVLGVPAHRAAEGLPLKMLARVLESDGCRIEEASTQLLPAQIEKMIEEFGARAVVVSILPPGGLPQAAYACRRYRKKFPDLPIVVAYWGPASHYGRVLERFHRAGATAVTTSLAQTAAQVRTALEATATPGKASVLVPSPLGGEG